MSSEHAEPFELATDGPNVLVVGVDGSRTSLRAGAYAAGLARRSRAHLVIVYAASRAGLAAWAPGGAAAIDQALDEIAADLRRQVEQRLEDWGLPSAVCTFVVARGEPFAEIARIAEEVRADGVIVGASMHTGHRLVGSLAVRLVRAGRWPVTVIP